MAQTQFYAIEDDLLPVLSTVEKKGQLKYTLAGRFLVRNLQCFHSGSDIPNLGRATSSSAHASERYLVSEQT